MRQMEEAEEVQEAQIALMDAGAALAETFEALLRALLLLSTTTTPQTIARMQQPTAELLPQLRAYQGAFAAWKAVSPPLHVLSAQLSLIMLEAEHVLRRNSLGGTIVHLHVSAKHRGRKLLHSDNSLPDYSHLFILELLQIILCMAGSVMAKFAALKLEIVFGHNKLEDAPASGTPAHWNWGTPS